MNKNKIYLLFFFLVLFVGGLLLFKNIQKPKFYVAGTIEATTENAVELSSFRYVFFAIHPVGPSMGMPFAMARIPISHDFSKGPYHFVLDNKNLFSPNKKIKLPQEFKLKLILSESDKISFADGAHTFSQIKENLQRAQTHVKFLF